ncbi:MAG: class I SAM-dependent methyltransferase, partial [Hyphomicrobiales bacterium]
MSEPQQAGGQTWSAPVYATNARFVAELGQEILSWADLKPGMRILDLGCGDGALTQKLVAAGGEVVAIDASFSMVEAARARGLDARIMSGEALEFDNAFDLVFSNAALHWMVDAEAVVRGVHRALVAGGRFVAEFGGHLNVAAIATALRAAAAHFNGDPALASPWYFPTPQAHGKRLADAGFEVLRITLIPRPTLLPTGMAGWLKTFRQPFFEQFDPEI